MGRASYQVKMALLKQDLFFFLLINKYLKKPPPEWRNYNWYGDATITSMGNDNPTKIMGMKTGLFASANKRSLKYLQNKRTIRCKSETHKTALPLFVCRQKP